LISSLALGLVDAPFTSVLRTLPGSCIRLSESCPRHCNRSSFVDPAGSRTARTAWHDCSTAPCRSCTSCSGIFGHRCGYRLAQELAAGGAIDSHCNGLERVAKLENGEWKVRDERVLGAVVSGYVVDEVDALIAVCLCLHKYPFREVVSLALYISFFTSLHIGHHHRSPPISPSL
jgi:hypothetical protein